MTTSIPDVCEPSDRNNNDIQDSCEIEQDPSKDADGDGILDVSGRLSD